MLVMEVGIMTASNSTVIADDGDSPVMAKPTGFPISTVKARTAERQASTAYSQPNNTSRPDREAGDQVNRFLLCTLVSESAKRIKVSAEKSGESLPMTTVVRGVLRAYRLAARDKYGPLAEPDLDIRGLMSLNEKVLRDEIARHSRDRVKNSETRLAHAERAGDDARVKAEKDGLEHAIALRDRITREYR
jgi:hypothetical protein